MNINICMVESDHTDQDCEGCPEYNPFNLTASQAFAKVVWGDTIQEKDGAYFVAEKEGAFFKNCGALVDRSTDPYHDKRFRVIKQEPPKPVSRTPFTRVYLDVPPEATDPQVGYKDGGLSVLRKGIKTISFLMPVEPPR